MKVNKDFIYKTMAGMPVLVPVGDAAKNINGMISLNGPAELIWKALEAGKDYDSIVAEIKAEYDADEAIIKKDLDNFLLKLKSVGALEE